MSKILHLNLHRKWFEMIASGEKKEEYRAVTKHWISRLIKPEYRNLSELHLIKGLMVKDTFRQDYTVVRFMNGYSKQSPVMEVELKGIHYGPVANVDWVENETLNWFFCIELGKILSIKNYKQ